MFCPKCGKINSENEEKCSGCGAQLHEEATVVIPFDKNKVKKITFAIIAVLIILIVAVLILNGCGTTTMPEESISF